MKENTRVKKFFSYYKPYKKLFFTDMFCAFIVAVITLIYPMLIRYVTNHVLVDYTSKEALDIILKIGVALLLLALVQMICNYYISYQGHMMGAYMEYDMRNEIFAHYQKLSYSFYDDQKVGQLMSRVTNDLFDITELCHHGPEDVVLSVIKFIGAFIILMCINWNLTLVLFILIPIMVFFASLMQKRMKRAFRRNREKVADINAQIEDSLSGVRVVKSFANEEVEIKHFKEGNDRFIDTKRDSYRYMGTFHSGLQFLISILNLVVVVGGGFFMVQGIIEVGDLLTFVLYVNNLIEPINKLINFTEQFQQGITGYSRFMDIMEIEPEIVDKPGAVELVNPEGNIEFKDVAFGYQEANANVFRHINIKVKAGDYIAIVGASGVGKTTLCNLIPRFYEIAEGEIKIDGINIQDVTQKSLRNNIGMVQQDVYLFAGTVIDNIRYGDLNASREEVIAAAKNANAHEFIMQMPNGYDTDIGQRGIKLSGGQKQRLSIARVFLKNPPILIFDEATSALDNESEKIVQDSLERLAKNRTTFVIAHRLTTIRNAKHILVLTEEGIKEQGSHEELMKMDGIYHNLYAMAVK